jgi:hypothetical protein
MIRGSVGKGPRSHPLLYDLVRFFLDYIPVSLVLLQLFSTGMRTNRRSNLVIWLYNKRKPTNQPTRSFELSK